MANNNKPNILKDMTPDRQKVFERVSKSINQWQQYFGHNQQAFREDKQFLFIEQWSNTERQEFNRLQKPIMTFNLIYDYYKKIVGQQRYSTPQLMVRREDDDFSGNPQDQQQIQKEIDIRTDIIRDIAYNSRSDIAYQMAFGNALAGGFGAIRVRSDYKNAYSFDQHIIIEGVENPERCFFDPNAKSPTKHDGDFVGYYVTMSREEFRNMYPDVSQPQSYPLNSSIRNFTWGNNDKITVVEYYEKQYYEFDLYLLSDGQKVTTKQYNKLKKEYEEAVELAQAQQINPLLLPPMPQKVGSRKSRDYRIMYYKLSANNILEHMEFAGKEFPIVFVAGDSADIDGREYTLSFTRYVKDAQRFLNYTKCEIAQAIKNGRREQYIATPDNLSGPDIERMWRNPSIQQGALIAKPDSMTGQLPQRVPPSEVPSSLIQQSSAAQQDIASILGLYEANRGEDGREKSGIAIKERQRTGNLGLIVYFDNLDRGIEQVGRVVLSMLPKIYDTERKMSLEKEDGTQYDATINQRMPDGSVKNDMTSGRYSLCVIPGPSFAAQRDDALNMLMQLAGANPSVFPLVADLIAENIDIENRTQLVERLKNLVPPAIIAQEEGTPPPTPQPNPEAQMAQMETMIKARQLQLKESELQLKEAQQKMEMMKLGLNAEAERRKDYVAGVKSNAEVHKATLDYRASLADALARVEESRMDLARGR